MVGAAVGSGGAAAGAFLEAEAAFPQEEVIAVDIAAGVGDTRLTDGNVGVRLEIFGSKGGLMFGDSSLR